MESVTGIFPSMEPAIDAVERLQRIVRPDWIHLLTPGSSVQRLRAVPVTEDMPPVGGAMLAIFIGTVTASIALLVASSRGGTAAGVVAMLLVGGLGAWLGWRLGRTADWFGFRGLPVDERYVYEDALRKDRSVVIVFVDDPDVEDQVHAVLEQAGAESLDEARQHWWLGVRDAEQVEYGAAGGNFPHDETLFRKGFEAALSPGMQGKRYEHARPVLRARYPRDAHTQAFRRGFERGQRYPAAQHLHAAQMSAWH